MNYHRAICRPVFKKKRKRKKRDFIKGFGRLQRLSCLQRINRKNTDTWKNVFYWVSNFDRKVAYYYVFINPVPQSDRLNVHVDPRSGRGGVAAGLGGRCGAALH